MNEKQTINEAWQNSPARVLALSNYLPESADKPAENSIHDSEQIRQDAALQIIKDSGELLGRASADRRMYLDTSGEKYGQVLFLSRAQELTNLFTQLDAAGSSLEAQDEAVINAVVDDINDLKSLNEKLFGSINKDRWGSIASKARAKALRIIADEESDENLKIAARNVLAHFPDIDGPSEEKSHAPTVELLNAWEATLRKKYQPLIELGDIEREDSYSSQDLKALFEQGLSVLKETWGFEDTDQWSIAIGKSNINVDHENSCVWIPEGKSFTPTRAVALLIHEIGGHLLRVLNGRKTGDALLSSDMPGRSTDEEALLVLFEQILSGKPRESGLTYYAAIALANSETTQPPVKLSELKPIVLDYLAVEKGRVLTNSETSTESVRVDRVTRGMPSIVVHETLYQTTYNADLKYAIGQENGVGYLEANIHRQEEALDEVMSGRFAYSNPVQTEYAREKNAALKV